MIDRPGTGERALLVQIDIGAHDNSDLAEFAELARSAGARTLTTIRGRRTVPDRRTFAGSGKVEEIRTAVVEHDAEIVLFNHALSPSQQRNLERALRCRVLDRTELILDIFAQRARSFEGKLQVELAQLRHLSTRLVRGWTHLERQKGGIGLRGPGETQLETDRRLITRRIRQLRSRLAGVERQREQGRRQRQRRAVATVSLVGYTNAGKSTLFNRLTGADVWSADQLFATLDPTLRRLELPDGAAAVLADTVGFLSDLPHELVAAFRATLRETQQARLLLHVIDASDPRRDEHIEAVRDVLAEIGANDVPQIEVYNKVDLIARPVRVEHNGDGAVQRVWVSAHTGEGIDELLDAVAVGVAQGPQIAGVVHLGPEHGRVRAHLFEIGAIRHETPCTGGGWEVELAMPESAFRSLCRREGLDLQCNALHSL